VLEFHDFPLLTLDDAAEVIDHWEETFLLERGLNLTSNDRMVDLLRDKSEGLLEPLYDLLRKVAIMRLDEPSLVLSPGNLAKRLSGRKLPRVKLNRKG
jgi:hypothetical protein